MFLWEIVKQQKDGWIECRFICHKDSGAESLCLDFGQNWNIKRGETFKVTQVQFDRALELIADSQKRVLNPTQWYEDFQAGISRRIANNQKNVPEDDFGNIGSPPELVWVYRRDRCSTTKEMRNGCSHGVD